MLDESKGTYTNLQGVEVAVRYFMRPAVVRAKRLSADEWEIQGPWAEPFRVSEEVFRQKFSEL